MLKMFTVLAPLQVFAGLVRPEVLAALGLLNVLTQLMPREVLMVTMLYKMHGVRFRVINANDIDLSWGGWCAVVCPVSP